MAGLMLRKSAATDKPTGSRPALPPGGHWVTVKKDGPLHGRHLYLYDDGTIGAGSIPSRYWGRKLGEFGVDHGNTEHVEPFRVHPEHSAPKRGWTAERHVAYARQHGPQEPLSERQAAVARVIDARKRVAVTVPSGLLRKIVETGRLRTAWEMAPAEGRGGRYAEKRRANDEAHHFGPQTVFGAVTLAGDERALSQYGDAMLVLRPEAAGRATYTAGDSFRLLDWEHAAGHGQVAHWGNVGDIAARYAAEDVRGKPNARNVSAAMASRIGYVEAQLHDGVRLRDIAEVLLPADKAGEREGLEAALRAAGSEAKVRVQGEAVRKSVGFVLRKAAAPGDMPPGLPDAYKRAYRRIHDEAADETPKWSRRAEGPKGSVWRASDGWGYTYFLVVPFEAGSYGLPDYRITQIATCWPDVSAYYFRKPLAAFAKRDGITHATFRERLGFGEARWDGLMQRLVDGRPKGEAVRKSVALGGAPMRLVLRKAAQRDIFGGTHREAPQQRSMFGPDEPAGYEGAKRKHATRPASGQRSLLGDEPLEDEKRVDLEERYPGGVWRTIRGHHVFVHRGHIVPETLPPWMREERAEEAIAPKGKDNADASLLGDEGAQAARPAAATELSRLKTDLAKVERRLAHFEPPRDAHLEAVREHFHLGTVGAAGKATSGLNARRARSVDRTIEAAKQHVELMRERDRLAAQVEDIESGARQARQGRKAKAIERAKGAHVGDIVETMLGAATVVRVNQKTLTVRTASGYKEAIPHGLIGRVLKPAGLTKSLGIVLRKSAGPGQHWVTIGGHDEGDRKHADGRHVLLNEDGTIAGGSVPRFFQGLTLKQISDPRHMHRQAKAARSEIDRHQKELARMEDSIPSLARHLAREHDAGRQTLLQQIRHVTEGQMITPDASEENRGEIPSYFKRRAAGKQRGAWSVDAVADALGITENELRRRLSEAHRRYREAKSNPERFEREAEEAVRGSDEYRSTREYLDMLREVLGDYRGPKHATKRDMARRDAGRRRKAKAQMHREVPPANRPTPVRKAFVLTASTSYGDRDFDGFGEAQRPRQQSRKAGDEVAVNSDVFAKGGRRAPPHYHRGDHRIYHCPHGGDGRMVLQEGRRYPAWVSERERAKRTRAFVASSAEPYWEKAWSEAHVGAPNRNVAFQAARGQAHDEARVLIDREGRLRIRGKDAQAVASRIRHRLDGFVTGEDRVDPKQSVAGFPNFRSR